MSLSWYVDMKGRRRWVCNLREAFESWVGFTKWEARGQEESSFSVTDGMGWVGCQMFVDMHGICHAGPCSMLQDVKNLGTVKAAFSLAQCACVQPCLSPSPLSPQLQPQPHQTFPWCPCIIILHHQPFFSCYFFHLSFDFLIGNVKVAFSLYPKVLCFFYYRGIILL